MSQESGRFQFSLRTLFAGMTIVCVWAGLVVFNVNQWQAARNEGRGFEALRVVQAHAVFWLIASVIALIVAWNAKTRQVRALSLFVAGLTAIGFVGNFFMCLGAL